MKKNKILVYFLFGVWRKVYNVERERICGNGGRINVWKKIKTIKKCFIRELNLQI